MLRYLIPVAVAALTIAPVARQSSTALPVKATLRLAGERSSFKIGEPVRLELALTADANGFVVDVSGPEDPADALALSPAEGVHRLRPIGGRDSFLIQNLLPGQPTVLPLAVNYWVRFDRAGSYTASITTNRVWIAGPGGSLDRQKAVPLTTNDVTFRIEPTSADDEQALISAAAQHLQSAIALGTGDEAFRAQIRAGEELAFLPGDNAALAKYRWYKELGAVRGIPSNAYQLLRRGFSMTRNPAVILAEVDAELGDLGAPVTPTAIMDATALAVAIKHPEYEPSFLPTPPGSSDPSSVERARYLQVVHESLERRTGLVKLLSAGAVLTVFDNATPPDIVRLIVDGFEQLPLDSRVWFASGRWDLIRDKRLGPALRRTLDEVEPGSREYIYPALIDVAPALAVEPLAKDLLDPSRLTNPDIVRKMPASSLRHVAPPLVAVIKTMLKAFDAGNHQLRFRIGAKLKLLAIVADGSVRTDLRALYDATPTLNDYDVRPSLLRYLLQYDPDEGLPRAKEALLTGDSDSVLYQLGAQGPIPALNMLLKERLFDRDPAAAEQAARQLAAHGRAEDRDGIELRLLQWRLDRQQRLVNGQALTDADGRFEAEMVRALAHGRAWKVTEADHDRLLAACLTPACKTALRERGP
jgi:hypothetical protein